MSRPRDDSAGALRGPPALAAVPGAARAAPWPAAAGRRALVHPLAPVVAAACAGVACLVTAPATADMAAHTFRAWLWETEGSVLWNAQWYGGHHAAAYSLLFPPLAGLVGPRAVGALAGVAAVLAFAAIAAAAARRRGERAPSPLAAGVATWLFAGGVVSNVVIGRMPFTLGIACAVGAWACGERARRSGGALRPGWAAAAAALSLAAVWASPVAGLFLCVAALGPALAGGAPGRSFAALVAGPALAGGLALAIAFPEGGPDRFVATAFWPMLALCAGGALLLDPGRRGLRVAVGAYLALFVLAYVVPSPLGQNVLRPGVLIGPALLVLFARPAATAAMRLALLTVVVGLVYLQWLPAARAVSEAAGDPSTRVSYYDDLLARVAPASRPGDRLEIPLTRNHWEAAHVATRMPLARGWHRQLDREFNGLFYGDAPLTARSYVAWLRERAVRWVALPAAELDISARREAALLRRGVPGLRQVWRTPRWTLWEVAGARAADGPGRLTATSPEGFELAVERAGVVRVHEHHTRYWAVTRGDACVRAGPRGWTELSVPHAGRVRVRARLSLRAALRRPQRCWGAASPRVAARGEG